MPEFLIGAAGALGMAIAVVHGYLGDTLVVRQAASGPETAFRVMRAIMFLSAVYWFVAGAALMAASLLAPPQIASWMAWGGGALFLSGAVGNLWATRGGHFGWALLAVATLLAWGGAAAL
ncbi:MAG: hypothetical protein AAGF90_21135 [Pseudomonadota bacterium]